MCGVAGTRIAVAGLVAYVDLRKGPTFGKVVTLEVGRDKAVFVPRGVGNSYQCLTDDVYYLYSVNQHWSEDAYKTSLFVNLADPAELGCALWPLALIRLLMPRMTGSCGIFVGRRW